LRARDRAAALERADQRRLLAADVAAGARVQMQLEAERAALYVLPEPAALARLADRVLQPLRGEPIFVAQEDLGRRRAARLCADDHPFAQQTRVALEQQPVLERAGLHLVGVGDQIA